jgi:hypothetical protein
MTIRAIVYYAFFCPPQFKQQREGNQIIIEEDIIKTGGRASFALRSAL